MPLFNLIQDTFDFASGNESEDDVAGDGLVDQIIAALPVDPFPDPSPEDNPFNPDAETGFDVLGFVTDTAEDILF